MRSWVCICRGQCRCERRTHVHAQVQDAASVAWSDCRQALQGREHDARAMHNSPPTPRKCLQVHHANNKHFPHTHCIRRLTARVDSKGSVFWP
jgi:hypothetical protein